MYSRLSPLYQEGLHQEGHSERPQESYTSSISGHALLKIVQNLLLQCFDDAVITFIWQETFQALFLPDEGDHSIIETLQ